MSEAAYIRILMVDDDIFNLDLVSVMLIEEGYIVTTASDGIEALDQIDRHQFEVVLLDVNMPNMDGLQTLEAIRLKYPPTELPVIMQTANDKSDDITRALRLGANDYVTKPLDLQVLQARIDTQVQLNQSTMAMRKDYQRIKSDVDRAMEVQQSLLPTNVSGIPGLEFAWKYVPHEELAGDSLNILPLTENEVALYVLDVCGHGIKSALLSSAIVKLIESFALKGEVVDAPPVPALPSVLAARVCHEFNKDLSNIGFVTLIYGVLNKTSRTFTYVSAGHPSPVVIRGGHGVEFPEEFNAAIGIIDDPVYEDQSLKLEVGDRIYLYSDGIIEARNANGEEFDLPRAVAQLEAMHGEPIEESLGKLIATVAEWRNGDPQDDISILGCEVK